MSSSGCSVCVTGNIRSFDLHSCFSDTTDVMLFLPVSLSQGTAIMGCFHGAAAKNLLSIWDSYFYQALDILALLDWLELDNLI